MLLRIAILALLHVPASFQRSTLQVKASTRPRRFTVVTDGDGIVNHAGTAALSQLADALGLTKALSVAMAPTRRRRSKHEPGRVLRDLLVMIADGGDCVSDLVALRDQPDLFGEVATTATAWRVIDGITEADLARLREARRRALEQAWRRGAWPQEIVLDFDATLITAHSENEQAAPTLKHGFGFHPLLCTLDGVNEILAGLLRPGNAGEVYWPTGRRPSLGNRPIDLTKTEQGLLQMITA